MAQLVASMSVVVLGGVVMVVGSNLARGKIFTAFIGSVDSLFPSLFIYCMNLRQFLFLIQWSSKAMMFVKLYFCTSDIYLILLICISLLLTRSTPGNRVRLSVVMGCNFLSRNMFPQIKRHLPGSHLQDYEG